MENYINFSICFECGGCECIETHHIIPQSKGGTKTVPLCFKCHSLVHNKGVRSDSASLLTKAALAAKKARGEKLGNAGNFSAAGRAKGRATNSANAANNQNTKAARERSLILRIEGYSLRKIAATLNNEGIKTPRGGQYSAAQVVRLWE